MMFKGGVPKGSVLGLLLLIWHTLMWFRLENMLVSYADDATFLACIPSPNRDLGKITAWCNLCSMRLNPNKTQYDC